MISTSRVEWAVKFILDVERIFQLGAFGEDCTHEKEGVWFERLVAVSKIDLEAQKVLLNWCDRNGINCPCNFAFEAILIVMQDPKGFPNVWKSPGSYDWEVK